MTEKKIKLMLVDDLDTHLYIFSTIIPNYFPNIEVVTFNNLDSAKDYLQQNEVDILLTDMKTHGKAPNDLVRFCIDNGIFVGVYSQAAYLYRHQSIDTIFENIPLYDKVRLFTFKTGEFDELIEMYNHFKPELEKRRLEKKRDLEKPIWHKGDLDTKLSLLLQQQLNPEQRIRLEAAQRMLKLREAIKLANIQHLDQRSIDELFKKYLDAEKEFAKTRGYEQKTEQKNKPRKKVQGRRSKIPRI